MGSDETAYPALLQVYLKMGVQWGANEDILGVQKMDFSV